MPHSVERFIFGHPHAVLRLPRRNVLKLMAHSAFVALVTACGGGGSNVTAPIRPPDPPTPVPLSDAIPAAGTTVDPSMSGFNVVQMADADWRFDYTGECGPMGVAVRHALTDLSGSGDDGEVVDHKLACELRPGTSYGVRVNATGGDGDRYRSMLEFTSDAERAVAGVTVLDRTRLSRGDVDGLFHRYVVDAVQDEIDIPIIGSLVALTVAEIAEQTWTELGRRESTYGVVSEAVSYASRGPSGAPATLSGLVAMPDVGDAPDYEPPGRIVVLTHGTGATPSGLSPSDGWYVLANLLAGRGYLVVAPDNWGRGVSAAPERPETYLMANRTANNALDMIRAVLDDGRYEAFHDALEPVPAALVGYSQGAHSAVALWLASAAGMEDTQKVAIREVYAGGGPHNLYATFRGALEEIGDRCDGNPWCLNVDGDAIEPYAASRILPAILRYSKVELDLDDVLDDGRLDGAFVNGMLNGEERFDALKTMLQLNTFTNTVGLASALSAESTQIHLYHSPFDRLVPQQNSRDLADTLLPGFDATAHFDACDSNAFVEIGSLVDKAGVIHAICAFEVFDRVLLDLRSGEEARTGRIQGALARLDPALPWRELAERRAVAAVTDAAGLEAFRAATAPDDLRKLSARLRVQQSPALRELADRLSRDTGQ